MHAKIDNVKSLQIHSLHYLCSTCFQSLHSASQVKACYSNGAASIKAREKQGQCRRM